MRDPISVGEENETPFIRVWKPLPSRCVLKTLRESSKGKPIEDNICQWWARAVIVMLDSRMYINCYLRVDDSLDCITSFFNRSSYSHEELTCFCFLICTNEFLPLRFIFMLLTFVLDLHLCCSMLVVATSGTGFVLGSGSTVDLGGLCWTCAGTMMVAASANSLNQVSFILNFNPFKCLSCIRVLIFSGDNASPCNSCILFMYSVSMLLG